MLSAFVSIILKLYNMKIRQFHYIHDVVPSVLICVSRRWYGWLGSPGVQTAPQCSKSKCFWCSVLWECLFCIL